MRRVLEAATRDGLPITVPAVVLAEWWRRANRLRNHILEMVTVEPLTAALAKSAGEALAMVNGATTIDALVMASAARRGDIVYTSDVGDLFRLQRFFPEVRVLRA